MRLYDLARQEMCTPQVTLFGHVFTGAGVTPDTEKVKAVKEWPTPLNTSEVRQFLGQASYYHRFIQHFSDVAITVVSTTIIHCRQPLCNHSHLLECST